MSEHEELWIPLVDEPIGSIVAQVEAEDPEIAELVDSPRKLLAFRTFAYIRVGIVLGQLLVDHDLEPYDGSETWADQLLTDPAKREQVANEVRAVAREIADDPSYAEDASIGPDEAARDRFLEFAKRRLAADA